jgi:hypothetical protein
MLGIAALTAFTLFLVAAASAGAQVAPFTVYGSEMQPGQKISAVINGELCLHTKVTESGGWSLVIPAGACGAAEGTKIKFKVDGQYAEGYAIWSSGGLPQNVELGIKLVVKDPVTKVGTFSSKLHSGVNIAFFSGGSVESAIKAAPGLKSMWVAVGGKFYGYHIGVPEFVNGTFLQKFSSGIPAGTGMLIIIH